MRSIIASGFVLLKPGDTTLDGDELKVTPGHIGKALNRLNLATNEQELFEPTKNIFLSPSIKLIECLQTAS